MSIISTAGGIILTGGDAAAFQEQIERGAPHPAAREMLQQGKRLVDQLREHGVVLIHATACRACDAPDCGCTDLEYAGLVPPRSTETRPVAIAPCGGSGRAAPSPPLARPNSSRSRHDR